MRCRLQKDPGLEQDAIQGAKPQQHLVVRHTGSGMQRTNGLQEQFEALRVQCLFYLRQLTLIGLSAGVGPRRAFRIQRPDTPSRGPAAVPKAL